MLRRTRATEGGSLICELCGRSSYKLYSTEVEVSADSANGKRSNQWKRASTEIAKVRPLFSDIASPFPRFYTNCILYNI